MPSLLFPVFLPSLFSSSCVAKGNRRAHGRICEKRRSRPRPKAGGYASQGEAPIAVGVQREVHFGTTWNILGWKQMRRRPRCLSLTTAYYHSLATLGNG